MRNLKKILALVLALVMSMSLLTVANAFEDEADIDETFAVAVNVLSGLEVFQGRTETEFAPKANITRAEVAAIIYRIVTGDVEGNQVGIYADYNKFEDVKSNNWFAGYVNYCANAEYIGGYGNGKFGPNDPVTGYQALAMILRAIGYNKNNDFQGSGWEVQTAAVGRERGITKNITTGMLGLPATREMVAEILFQAIMVPTVDWTLAFGYTLSETSLGWETFKLEGIKGIVTSNEWANLYGSNPSKADRTVLVTDEKSYTLATSTEITDLGESRIAYITNGSKVLYMADAGNTVYETGEYADISSPAKFEKATGLKDADALRLLNFGYYNNYYCEYLLTIAYDDNGTIKEYVVPHDTYLEPAELDALWEVFDNNELYVYVGTKDTQKDEDDKSDTMTYWQFVEKYLIADAANLVQGNENGNWLKVIDNDQDGYADYVLKTRFFMNKVIDVDTVKGVKIVEFAKDFADADIGYDEDEDTINVYDDIAQGDVVVVTEKIDGNYYMQKADSFTGVVTDVIYKTDSIIVDGETYGQSAIASNVIVSNDLDMFPLVIDADEKTEYNFYQDAFGTVRAYEYADTSSIYALLTEAYEDNYYRNQLVRKTVGIAEVTIGDAKTLEYIVTNHGATAATENYFISGHGAAAALLGAGYIDGTVDVVGDVFLTNIAKYNNLSDEEIALYNPAALQDGNRKSTRIVELDVQDGVAAKTSRYNNVDGVSKYVSTSPSTEYYYVVRDDNDVKSVAYRVGYATTPEIPWDAIYGAYALTQINKVDAADGSYDVAKVIVFELNRDVLKSAEDLVLAYYSPEKSTGKVRLMNIINGKGEDTTLYTPKLFNDVTAWTNSDLDFYQTINNKDEAGTYTLEKVTAYSDYRIYAGTIDRWNGLEDHYDMKTDSTGTLKLNAEGAVIYEIKGDKKPAADSDVKLGKNNSVLDQEIIWVENAKGEVIYIVKVMYKADGTPACQALTNLFDAIIAEAANTVSNDYDGLKKQANDLITALGALSGTTAQNRETVNKAKALLALLKNTTQLKRMGLSDLEIADLQKNTGAGDTYYDLNTAYNTAEPIVTKAELVEKTIAKAKEALLDAIASYNATHGNIQIDLSKVFEDTTKVNIWGKNQDMPTWLTEWTNDVKSRSVTDLEFNANGTNTWLATCATLWDDFAQAYVTAKAANVTLDNAKTQAKKDLNDAVVAAIKAATGYDASKINATAALTDDVTELNLVGWAKNTVNDVVADWKATIDGETVLGNVTGFVTSQNSNITAMAGAYVTNYLAGLTDAADLAKAQADLDKAVITWPEGDVTPVDGSAANIIKRLNTPSYGPAVTTTGTNGSTMTIKATSVVFDFAKYDGNKIPAGVKESLTVEFTVTATFNGQTATKVVNHTFNVVPLA